MPQQTNELKAYWRYSFNEMKEWENLTLTVFQRLPFIKISTPKINKLDYLL